MTVSNTLADASFKKVLLIINPRAGSCNPEMLIEYFRQKCAEHSITPEVYETQGEDAYDSIVDLAIKQGVDGIIACGGDGTVSSVASGLLDQTVPLAIVPAGTANVLAKELNISLDHKRAMDVIFEPHNIRRIDAMKVGKKSYFSHISIGVYSKIAERTRPEIKKRFGRLAYIWQVVQLMRHPRRWTFDVVTDDQSHRVKASTIMIASAGAMGALDMRWAPDVTADDGQVSVCVIKASLWKEYREVFWAFLRGRHKSTPFVAHFGAKRLVRIANNARLAIRGDGEIVGHGDLEIRVMPSAVAVLVPILD